MKSWNEMAAAGFTLIELLVTVAIVGTLAAVSIPAYYNYTLRSRQSAVIGELMSIKAAEERFYAVRGAYAGRLNTLVNPDEPDPAKREYMYAANATYTNGSYRYFVTADTSALINAGIIRAEGDPNGDGNFTDIWEVPIEDLEGKPKPPDGVVSDEGFAWSSLANLFK